MSGYKCLVIKTVSKLTAGLGLPNFRLKSTNLVTEIYYHWLLLVIPLFWHFTRAWKKYFATCKYPHISYVKPLKKEYLSHDVFWFLSVIHPYSIKFVNIVLTGSKPRSNSAVQSVIIHCGRNLNIWQIFDK